MVHTDPNRNTALSTDNSGEASPIRPATRSRGRANSAALPVFSRKSLSRISSGREWWIRKS